MRTPSRTLHNLMLTIPVFVAAILGVSPRPPLVVGDEDVPIAGRGCFARPELRAQRSLIFVSAAEVADSGGQSESARRIEVVQRIQDTRRRALESRARGLFYTASRDLAEAVTLGKQAFGAAHWRVRDAELWLEHVDRMRRLPPDQYLQAQRVQFHYIQAAARDLSGTYAGALQEARDAQRLSQQLLGGNTIQDFEILGTIGSLQRGLGSGRSAVEAYQDQFLVGQKTLGEEHPETVLTLSKLGEAMTVTSQFYGAEKLLWRALDLAKRLYEREKDDEDVRAYYAICCVNLACFCVEADEPEKAERLYLRACDLLQGPPKGRDDVYSIVLLQLSQARLANGRGDEAVKTASSAVEMIKGHWGAEHRNYGRALAVLADAHLETGHLQEAESLLKQSQEILRRGNDGPDQVTLELGDMTAKLYCKQGKPSEAHELLEKLLAVMEPAWGAEHPMLRSPLRQLAAAKRTLGQETEAQLLERRAQQIEAELSEYKRRRSFNRTWD